MILPISKKECTFLQKPQNEKCKPKHSFKEIIKQKPKIQKYKRSIFDFAKNKKPSIAGKKKEQEEKKDFIGYMHCSTENSRDICISLEKPESPSILELSPTMQDLINKMEGYISTESQNGIATVEFQMNLEDPYGHFHGTTIRIDHYNTNPHSFNILLTNPNQSAVEELTTYLPNLLKILETKLENFHIALLPPAYPKLEKIACMRKANKTLKGETKGKQKLKQLKEISS